jgi:hypothetical protein
MFAELISLGIPAVSIGFMHCLCGPDHYVPFVAMSRVGLWSLRKTLLITMLCGVGHVLGSVTLAFIGVALGLILSQLEELESFRGDIAAWLLLGFGIAYTLWGIYHAARYSASDGGSVQLASGQPPANDLSARPAVGDHGRAAELMQRTGQFTPWVLFVIFLLGPCEPLIPMLMVPASQANIFGVMWVTLLFGLTTLLTMTTLVALIYLGLFSVPMPSLRQWGHALAGTVVIACGASILWLGL